MKKKFKFKKKNWKLIGHIGVDAGLCWIGDPCYIIQDAEESRPKDLGKDWSEFCDKLSELRCVDPDPQDIEKGHCTKDFKIPYIHCFNYRQFNYDLGHAGLGVCVQTGYGDGHYPVYARFDQEEDLIAEIRIKFI